MALVPEGTARIEGYMTSGFDRALIEHVADNLYVEPIRSLPGFKWALGDNQHFGHSTLVFLGFPVTDKLIEVVTTGEPCINPSDTFDCIGKGLHQLESCIVFGYDCPELAALKGPLHHKIAQEIERPRHSYDPSEFIGHITVARFTTKEKCEAAFSCLSDDAINKFRGEKFQLTGFTVVKD